MTARSMYKPRRFGHSNLFISNIQQSMDFYNRVVGLEECFQEPAMHAGFMGNGNSHHDVGLTQISEVDIMGRDNQVLVPAGFGRKTGLFHCAFEVENEAELVDGFRLSTKAGVKTLITVDHTLAKSVYLIDPEGNVMEMTADSTKDWRKTFRDYAGKLVTGPWKPGEHQPSTDKNYPVNPEIRRVPEALMHARRTTHASLACRDLPAQTRFYREVIGLTDAFGAPTADMAVLKGSVSSASLVLFQAGAGVKPGYFHMAYEVPEDDLDGAEQRLQAAGVRVVSRFQSDRKHSIMALDPDGHRTEFFALRSRTDSPHAELSTREYWMVAA